MTHRDVQQALRKIADPKRATSSARFFKTGKGEYGEGDKFLGIRVPNQRAIAHRHLDLPRSEISKLLAGAYHEDRFTALEILVAQYERATRADQAQIVKFYLAHTNRINNWDLVDTSAPYILGHYLFYKPKEMKILKKLAASNNIWERRIAIIATLYFIGKGRFDETIALAAQLLRDKHDLIQKAVGWALREVGKRDANVLEKFLATRASRMPRTMLRYAIEKLTKEKRDLYLRGTMGI